MGAQEQEHMLRRGLRRRPRWRPAAIWTPRRRGFGCHAAGAALHSRKRLDRDSALPAPPCPAPPPCRCSALPGVRAEHVQEREDVLRGSRRGEAGGRQQPQLAGYVARVGCGGGGSRRSRHVRYCRDVLCGSRRGGWQWLHGAMGGGQFSVGVEVACRVLPAHARTRARLPACNMVQPLRDSRSPLLRSTLPSTAVPQERQHQGAGPPRNALLLLHPTLVLHPAPPCAAVPHEGRHQELPDLHQRGLGGGGRPGAGEPSCTQYLPAGCSCCRARAEHIHVGCCLGGGGGGGAGASNTGWQAIEVETISGGSGADAACRLALPASSVLCSARPAPGGLRRGCAVPDPHPEGALPGPVGRALRQCTTAAHLMPPPCPTTPPRFHPEMGEDRVRACGWARPGPCGSPPLQPSPHTTSQPLALPSALTTTRRPRASTSSTRRP